MLRFRLGERLNQQTANPAAVAQSVSERVLQGTDWHVVRVAQTWRDTSGLRMFGQAWSHLWGEPGSSTEWHVCSVRKAGAQYSYYVDGQLVGTEPATRTPNLIVLGNAGGMASDWSDFKVDYVTILAPGAPTLEWTTGVGFAADGVSPEGGHEGDSFEFRARYVDLDGDRPDRGVRLRLFRNGVEVGNSPFGTTRVGGDINGDGLVYSRTRPLSAGRYTYSFEATGNGEPATGPASLLNPGPVVTSPPKLYAPKFSPAAGGAATKYRFRVRYRTSDGLPAQWVQLQLRVQTPTSGWTTHVYRKYDRAAGTLAHWTLRLGQLYPDATAFRHRYRAYKVVGPIRDLATTAWTNGPTVNSSTSAPLTMTSAAAQATNGGGAEIMFRLSAPGGVTATVLNVAGREVRTLSTVDAEAGLQRVLWDGRSDSGLGVPAGRYVVRIEARSESGELARAMTALSIRR